MKEVMFKPSSKEPAMQRAGHSFPGRGNSRCKDLRTGLACPRSRKEDAGCGGS